MLRFKGYSMINIAGLAISIACAILIFLYIQFEFSFDRYHENSDRIFRVVLKFHRGDKEFQSPVLPAALGPSLKEEFPDIEGVTRIFNYSWKQTLLVSNGQNYFHENRFFLADPSIFKLFSFEFVKGNPETAFPDRNSIVITEETAKKYFGNQDPMGKRLSVENLGNADFKVTGIIKSMPDNSHFKCDLLAPVEIGNSLFWKDFSTGWGGCSFYTYLLLPEDYSYSFLEGKFPGFSKKFMTEYGTRNELFLQPLTSIHLYSQLRSEIEKNGNINNIYFFLVIALVILLIAAINFVNLSTARSELRAKEVGLRKVVGAKKVQLMKQFLSESILFSLFSLPFALVLSELFLPAFNRIVGKELEISLLGNSFFSYILVLLVIMVGFLSGIYPAFLIASFKPVKTLKGLFKSKQEQTISRNVLVIFQSAVSIIFIISTLIIGGQIDFIKSRDPGYQKDYILVIPIKDREILRKYDIIKNELNKYASIISVTASSGLPSYIDYKHALEGEGMQSDKGEIKVNWLSVDYDFLNTFGIKLKQGRDFSSLHSSDKEEGYIINETAARFLGWQEPLGKQIQLSNKGLVNAEFKMGTVIGVVRNFHFRSLHEKIEPLIINLYPHKHRFISVRYEPGSFSETLGFIKSKWKELNPYRPLDSFLFSENVGQMYSEEERVREIARYSTILSILIAVLGFLGLASFQVARYTKEIGIRKVLGASVSQILFMLSREFSKSVFLAVVLAWPIAFFIMKKWLGNFAYRESLSIWTFIFSGALLLGITLITVSFLSIKAALTNPVDVLKYE